MNKINKILMLGIIFILCIELFTAQQNKTNDSQKNYTIYISQEINPDSKVSVLRYSPSIEKEFNDFTFRIILIGLWLVLTDYVLNNYKEISKDWGRLKKNRFKKYMTLNLLFFFIWFIFSIVISWYALNLYNQIREYF